MCLGLTVHEKEIKLDKIEKRLIYIYIELIYVALIKLLNKLGSTGRKKNFSCLFVF